LSGSRAGALHRNKKRATLRPLRPATEMITGQPPDGEWRFVFVNGLTFRPDAEREERRKKLLD